MFHSEKLKKLYEQDELPSIDRKIKKRLLNMAVSQVHFKCNETWYVQKDGLAKGASLAVILANLQNCTIEGYSRIILPEKDLNGICLSAIRRSHTGQKMWNVNAV